VKSADDGIGPGDLIEVMFPLDGALHTVEIALIGLVNGQPMIEGRDETGTRRLVDPGWILRAVEAER
jgi:hypothetical protein